MMDPTTFTGGHKKPNPTRQNAELIYTGHGYSPDHGSLCVQNCRGFKHHRGGEVGGEVIWAGRIDGPTSALVTIITTLINV